MHRQKDREPTETCPQSRERKSTFVHMIHHPNDTDVQVIQHRLCQEGRGLSLLVVTVNTFDLRQGAQEGILIDGTVSWHRKCVYSGDQSFQLRGQEEASEQNQISKDVARAVQTGRLGPLFSQSHASRMPCRPSPATVLLHQVGVFLRTYVHFSAFRRWQLSPEGLALWLA